MKDQILLSQMVLQLIYRYKGLKDYYVLVDDLTNGGLFSIKDNGNSKFYHIKQRSYDGKVYYNYYAYIKNFNNEYEITIGEKVIKINELNYQK